MKTQSCGNIVGEFHVKTRQVYPGGGVLGGKTEKRECLTFGERLKGPGNWKILSFEAFPGNFCTTGIRLNFESSSRLRLRPVSGRLPRSGRFPQALRARTIPRICRIPLSVSRELLRVGFEPFGRIVFTERFAEQSPGTPGARREGFPARRAYVPFSGTWRRTRLSAPLSASRNV